MPQVDDNAVREFLKKQILVKNWIEEVLKVKLGDDLISSLKNGIVLCYLMQEIDPVLIPKIQEATKTDFRLKENVSFFLDACQELGMAKYERFQPNELWGTPNIARVVECIYCLSKIAAQRNFSPTLKPLDSVPDSKVALPQGKALQELKTMLANVGGSRAGKVTKISAELMRRKMAYLVGQNVDFSQCEAGFAKFQALYRGFAARQKYKKRIRDLAYRERVAAEILKTERDYVKNLDALIKVYLIPLSDLATSKKPVLTKEQIKGIFADVQSIYTFNESLLRRIEQRVANWSIHQKLGDIFVDIVGFLKVYTNYIQNFNNSLAILSTVGKKPVVAKFLKECTEDPRCKSLDLSALLIMPVQRIPRYHLLLQDLVKHTWPTHNDYQNLSDAMEKVKQVGTMLNEKKREAEDLAETFERHSWIKGKELDVTPDRRFIREDTFTNVKKGSDYAIYLFNDIIVYGKPISVITPGKTRIKFKGLMATIDCEITEKAPVKNYKFCFSLGDAQCAAKTEEERTDYFAAVKKAKEVASAKLSSHLKARMVHHHHYHKNIPKKNFTLKRNKSEPIGTDPQPLDAVPDAANSSVEDLLRMRKKQLGGLSNNSSPALSVRASVSTPNHATSRSTASLARANTTTAAGGIKKSESDKNITITNSSGELTTSSEASDGGASVTVDLETLTKTKNNLIQQLLGLPSDPAKDTKKTKKQRADWEHELEVTLRKISDLDQHSNVSPIRESDLSPRRSTALSSRSSPQTTARERDEFKRQFTSTGAVAVPVAALTSSDSKRSFNSIRGYQPTNANNTNTTNNTNSTNTNNVSPPTRSPSSPNISPNNSPSPPSNDLPEHVPPPKSASTNSVNGTYDTTSPKKPTSAASASNLHLQNTRSPSPMAKTRPAGLGPTLTGPTRTQSTMVSQPIEPLNLDGDGKPVYENLTFDQVKIHRQHLDTNKLESYLSESEFTRLFKVTREEFYKQPKWKQDQQKKDSRL